jgi:hypothetical protein
MFGEVGEEAESTMDKYVRAKVAEAGAMPSGTMKMKFLTGGAQAAVWASAQMIESVDDFIVPGINCSNLGDYFQSREWNAEQVRR